MLKIKLSLRSPRCALDPLLKKEIVADGLGSANTVYGVRGSARPSLKLNNFIN